MNPNVQQPAATLMRALTLELGEEVFAIEATSVREVLDLVPITVVPNAPAFASGLINVRGRVVPLADLRVKFGMERRPPDADTRIVVSDIDLAGEPMVVGILADKVHSVADLDMTGLAAPPDVGIRWRPEFVRGIATRDGQFIIVPEMRNIFKNDAAVLASAESEGRT